MNGWHDLPSGGTVEIKAGIPFQVSDKGFWNLEETQILTEAATFTNTRLEWATAERSSRWKSASIWAPFKTPYEQRHWAFAKVLRAGCEKCGNEVGVRFHTSRLSEKVEWVCDKCWKRVTEIFSNESDSI
ncbi:hypothetical protein CH378_19920 [Leptospira kmetyi]|uniref:Uncharacterized protein n=1 Tax=Leptospira kmetyi TaxID=408139 RepID=A0ABX4N3Z2_9LEPT|nr:hypothetical protein CH378_19920 [Leptospira kmetyi]